MKGHRVMSRIRGFEAKIENDKVKLRRRKREEKKKNEDQLSTEQKKIRNLLLKLPKLDALFNVHRKIGEGTFSSVYLGSLKTHAALPERERRWYAIKHLVPTAHPARVEQELRCLQDIGGEDHVIGVELCLRHHDNTVFIMPYIPHSKFSEYASSMDAAELQRYMRALLLALRRVHEHGVIHRDVKPNNFLYNRRGQQYLLVDFGLAQRVVGPTYMNALATVAAAKAARGSAPKVLVEAAGAPAAYKRTRDQMDDIRLPPAKRMAWDMRGAAKSYARGDTPNVRVAAARARACACSGAGGVCGACAARPAPRAPRAGTQGFRPPEVLLKYQHQTTAVDMWACGVVLASALLGRYPLLRARDDLSTLAELAALLGSRPLEDAARRIDRRLLMSSRRRGLCLRRLCAYVRRPPAPAPAHAPRCVHCGVAAAHCLCRGHTQTAHRVDPECWWGGFPDAVFSLATRLLEPDPARRITAEQALQHPFITTAYS